MPSLHVDCRVSVGLGDHLIGQRSLPRLIWVLFGRAGKVDVENEICGQGDVGYLSRFDYVVRLKSARCGVEPKPGYSKIDRR